MKLEEGDNGIVIGITANVPKQPLYNPMGISIIGSYVASCLESIGADVNTPVIMAKWENGMVITLPMELHNKTRKANFKMTGLKL